MVSTGLSLITAIVASSCLMITVTEQHNWHSKPPYSWDGRPVKYSRQIPYKPHRVEKTHEKPDRCELRKVVFTQDAESPQYVVYKTKIPDLKEFTLCHWHNIFNYTHDHPIFSYTQPGKNRLIYSWIENSPEKTYYSLAVNGHTIYRINYPEKLFKWYHVCQSWNGHTGEWQLWINAERVGRGFYNLMVGRMIKGGGVAISGREYLEQALAVHHTAFSGELTLVSLYKAALTAGKAYNDHKHHHVHNFHHGYDEAVDEADTEEPETPAAPEPTRPPHLAHGGPFVNGQLVHKLPGVAAAEAATGHKGQQQQQSFDGGLYDQRLFDGGLYDFYAPLRGAAASTGGMSVTGTDDTFRVNLLDGHDDRRYKRNEHAGDANEYSEDAAVDAFMDAATGHVRTKRNATSTVRPKRWTPVIGRSDPYGLYASSSERKREPAEWEVTKVASVCAACEPDPFGPAAVLSWHDTRKQFYNGAHYLPALPKCYLF